MSENLKNRLGGDADQQENERMSALHAPQSQGVGSPTKGERVLSPDLPSQGGEDHVG